METSARVPVPVAAPVLQGGSAGTFQGGNVGEYNAYFCWISFPLAECDGTARPRFRSVN